MRNTTIVSIVLGVIFGAFQVNSVFGYTGVFDGVVNRIPKDFSSTSMQGETHFLVSSCTNKTLSIKSSNVDLSEFEGKKVVAFGSEENVEHRVIEISSIYESKATKCGLVAGSIEDDFIIDIGSAKDDGGSLDKYSVEEVEVRLKSLNSSLEYQKRVEIGVDNKFFFENLDIGTYEIYIPDSEGVEQTKTFKVSISTESPIRVHNFYVPQGNAESNKVPIMDNIGVVLTLIIISSVFSRRKIGSEV